MERLLRGSMLLLLAVLLTMSGCGGGGGGEAAPAAPPAATKAVLTVSLQGTLPAGTSIGAVDLTVTLPAGVTAKVKAGSAETDAGVVVPSGNGAGSTVVASYTAATATAPGSIRIGLINATGIKAGDCLTLNLDIGGAVPGATGFGTSGLIVNDVNGAALGGMAAALTLQLI